MNKATDIFTHKLATFKEGQIVLLIIPIDRFYEMSTVAIKLLQQQNYIGVYISLAKDYLELNNILNNAGVDLKKMYFIDGISRMYGIKEIKSDQVAYVAGPLSLSEISKKVEEIIGKTAGQKKFIFLDSITVAVLYNSVDQSIEFGRFLIDLSRKQKVIGIISAITRTFANKALVESLTKISDEVIDLSK